MKGEEKIDLYLLYLVVLRVIILLDHLSASEGIYVFSN